MGAARSGRGGWAEGLDVEHLPVDKAEVLFHAGCRICYDNELQKNARAAVNILLDRVRPWILGEDELCCGGRIYWMGYRDDFTQFAKANLATWAKAGIKTVILPALMVITL